LQLCWHMYIDDNGDALPPNATIPGGDRAGWIATTNVLPIVRRSVMKENFPGHAVCQ
jgi:hypothetical protein